MDFTKFDNRGPAEEGQRLELLDPRTRKGEPLLEGENPCVVIVRGATARSVQAEMRKRRRQKVIAKNANDAEKFRVMEDVHADLCVSASQLIVGFENIERNGVPLDADNPDDVKWFLDLTFPVMSVKKDEDGDPILDENGQVQFHMVNNPFAKQISDFSSEQVIAMGNGEKG